MNDVPSAEDYADMFRKSIQFDRVELSRRDRARELSARFLHFRRRRRERDSLRYGLIANIQQQAADAVAQGCADAVAKVAEPPEPPEPR
jgi:hypothetical protein